jgi:hypothetical protein
MSIFKRAKGALINLFVPRAEPKPETEKATQAITAVAKARKALKYAFVSTRDYVLPNGQRKRQTATLNVGRNKEKRAAGRGKTRYAMGFPLGVAPLRRAMLRARRARQVAA